MSDEKKTLYERLGGYDAIVAVANDLLPRLRADPQRGRFWAHRGEDGAWFSWRTPSQFLKSVMPGTGIEPERGKPPQDFKSSVDRHKHLELLGFSREQCESVQANA